MPELDPVTTYLVLGSIAVIVFVVASVVWRRVQSAAARARHQAELRRRQATQERELEAQHQLADQILATSSTAEIVGFSVVRQIEAVFTDGHKTPAAAIDTLKALAARKGANALLNLVGERQPGGACTAHADAVIVKTLDAPDPPGRRR